MSIVDAISDFMLGARKRAGKRTHRKTTAKGKKHPCHCHAYPFPHASGGGECTGTGANLAHGKKKHAARYFGKRPKSGKTQKGPYYRKPGTSSPFHECVSRYMDQGDPLPVASRRCSRMRSAAIHGKKTTHKKMTTKTARKASKRPRKTSKSKKHRASDML